MTNTRSIIIALLAGCLILTFMGGCSDKSKAQPPEPTVARVGTKDISTDDLKRFLENRPLVKRDRKVGDAVRKRLDEMVLEEVLFQEAMAQKLDQDPEVQKAVRQLLISKLMETRVEKPVWEKNATPERVRDYYEAHRHEFERPEQIRLADILIAVPADAGPDKREALRQKAENVFAEAVKARNKRGGFSRLIEQYSDTPALYDKGDTGFIDQEGGPSGIDRRLAKAAFDIDKNGELAKEFVEADDGFHIIMRVAKRAAINIPLEKVENNLVRRIRKESLETERERYLRAIMEKSKIRVYEKELGGIIHEAEKNRQSAAQFEKRRLARSGKGTTPPVLGGE